MEDELREMVRSIDSDIQRLELTTASLGARIDALAAACQAMLEAIAEMAKAYR